MALKIKYVIPAGAVIDLPHGSLPINALSGSYVLAEPVANEDGYARIEWISGGKKGLQFSLRCYPSQDRADAAPIWSAIYAFFPEGELRWDAQAYCHLKTLPEFAGAQDC